jgi:hypothetical protein
MIDKCPSNCEHEYEFPHSVITKIRTVQVGGKDIQVIYEFVICRFCHHWIARQVRDCECPYFCHDKLGGLLIVRTPLDVVN